MARIPGAVVAPTPEQEGAHVGWNAVGTPCFQAAVSGPLDVTVRHQFMPTGPSP